MPWSALRIGQSGREFILDVDRETLKKRRDSTGDTGPTWPTLSLAGKPINTTAGRRIGSPESEIPAANDSGEAAQH